MIDTDYTHFNNEILKYFSQNVQLDIFNTTNGSYEVMISFEKFLDLKDIPSSENVLENSYTIKVSSYDSLHNYLFQIIKSVQHYQKNTMKKRMYEIYFKTPEYKQQIDKMVEVLKQSYIKEIARIVNSLMLSHNKFILNSSRYFNIFNNKKSFMTISNANIVNDYIQDVVDIVNINLNNQDMKYLYENIFKIKYFQDTRTSINVEQICYIRQKNKFNMTYLTFKIDG